MELRAALVATSVLLALGSAATTNAADLGIQPVTECRTIKPGPHHSYELKTNIVSEGGDCIVIEVDNITLDLNGFIISGNVSGGDGITDKGERRQGITIRNGTIYGFDNGINLAASDGIIVKDMQVASGVGVSVGRSGLVVDSNISNNGEGGLVAGFGSTIARNVFNGNSGFGGVQAQNASTIIDNTASGNLGNGIRVTGAGNTLRNNTASNNGGLGLEVTCPSAVIGNTAVDNGKDIPLSDRPNVNLVLDGASCLVVDNLVPDVP